MKSGDFVPEAYNAARDRVGMDSIEKGQRVMTIIDLNQIWFIDNKFGISARLQQVLLEPSKKLPAFAFQGVQTETAPTEETDEFDDGDVDI